MNEIQIYTDGGARGNPGPAASSFVVIKDNKTIFEDSIFLGTATNNMAEYQAVLAAYNWLSIFLKNISVNRINFFLDSQLVVNQLNGKYKIKSVKLKPIIENILNIQNKIKCEISYSFIRRKYNRRADFLLNKKLDDSIKKISRSAEKD